MAISKSATIESVIGKIHDINTVFVVSPSQCLTSQRFIRTFHNGNVIWHDGAIARKYMFRRILKTICLAKVSFAVHIFSKNIIKIQL